MSFDFEDPKRILKLCPQVETMVRSAARHDAAFRALAGEHLYAMFLEDWCSEEGGPPTRIQFEKRLVPMELIVENDGGFVFLFDDDDLFQGHQIAVYGTLAKGGKRADLAG